MEKAQITERERKNDVIVMRKEMVCKVWTAGWNVCIINFLSLLDMVERKCLMDMECVGVYMKLAKALKCDFFLLFTLDYNGCQTDNK